jgi:thiamine biosynthesis lipoprotein
MPAEGELLSGATFRAMGTDAQVIVVGGPAGLEQRARNRIAELEQRWSRFIDHSEVSALNRGAGAPVKVSPETVELVRRAIDAWRLTGGLFDPTVLGAVIRAGYDRSFEALGSTPRAGASDLTPGACNIEILDDIVRLPHGSGFDPGGLAKGLAADIVAEELQAAGAEGVCVNLGGDVRVCGTSPQGGAWTVAVDHPWCADPITRLGITHGAVATSTTLRRRWRVDGEERHHLIDPTTGQPSTSRLNFVTVVTGYAWAAEMLTKAVLLRGAPHHFDLLASIGGEAIAIDDRGHIDATLGMSAFLADPDLPSAIDPDRLRTREPAC